MRQSVRSLRFLATAALASAALFGASSGCSSMAPGKMADVRAVSDKPRVGNVYLLRGFIGIFSTGIDHLGQEVAADGIAAHVYQDDQHNDLAETLAQKYRNTAPADREPLVLIGHSYGADDVVRIARTLDAAHVPVDLVVTLDPVTPPKVPGNVALTYNLYRSNGFFDKFPWFRGIPLEPAVPGGGKLMNIDIRTDPRGLMEPGTDHFNIEKKGKVHQAVLEQVRLACPPRAQWAAMNAARRGETPTPVVKIVPPPSAPRENAVGPTRLAGSSESHRG